MVLTKRLSTTKSDFKSIVNFAEALPPAPPHHLPYAQKQLIVASTAAAFLSIKKECSQVADRSSQRSRSSLG